MVRHLHRHRVRKEKENFASQRGLWPRRHSAAPALLSALVFAILILLFGSSGCRQDHLPLPRQREKFSIATPPAPASTPFYVGIDQGFFKEEGLDVSLKPVATGRTGLETVLSGQADAAGTADIPIVVSVVKGHPIAIIATLAEIQQAVAIIAKKESGIAKQDDLKGKTIGVTRGTGAEFFLHIFLVTNNINPADVRIVDIEPNKIVGALLAGEVEAVSTWSPYKLALLEKLGRNAVLFTEPALYKQTFNLVTRRDFARSNPETLKKFLRGVLRAADFTRNNPGKSQSIMAKHIGTRSMPYRKEWSDYSFTISLDQSLVLNLEDQARWILSQSADTPQKTPNFMDFINTGPLQEVQPHAVRIFGR